MKKSYDETIWSQNIKANFPVAFISQPDTLKT